MVNKNEKFPKLISLFVDLKINSFITNPLSNGMSDITVTIIIKVLIFGLKVFASSHNPTTKKII